MQVNYMQQSTQMKELQSAPVKKPSPSAFSVELFLEFGQKLPSLNFKWVYPNKHTTWILRWNDVETVVSTSFQRGIHVVCLLGYYYFSWKSWKMGLKHLSKKWNFSNEANDVFWCSFASFDNGGSK